MATYLKQLNLRSVRSSFYLKSASKHSSRPASISYATAAPTKRYSITILPGDGIGPETISVAKDVLKLIGSLEGHLSLFPNYDFLIGELKI